MADSKSHVSEAEKVRILRMIETTLMRSESPTLRACGLTEETLEALKVEDGEEPIVDLWIVADDGSDLDRHRVNKITARGLGLMARADVAPQAPIPISMASKPQSIRERFWKHIWDIIKIAFGTVLGWVLKGCDTPSL